MILSHALGRGPSSLAWDNCGCIRSRLHKVVQVQASGLMKPWFPPDLCVTVDWRSEPRLKLCQQLEHLFSLSCKFLRSIQPGRSPYHIPLKWAFIVFFFYSVTHFHEAGNSVIIAETSFVPLTWNWPLGSKVTRDGKIQTDTECTFISLFSTKTKFKKKKYGMCIVMRAEKDCIDCSIWFAEHTRSAAACSQCYGWKHITKSFFLS